MTRKYRRGYTSLSPSQRRAYHRRADKAYQARHRTKKKARNKITNAQRDGKIKKRPGMEFHHTDYKNNKGKWIKKSRHRRIKRK